MKPEKALGLGALAAGGLASLCCLGPLAFATLGLGAFGAGAFFDSARPVLAVVLAVCGASGLVLAHRKREVACEDGNCRLESASRGTKALLWSLTGMGILLFITPYFL
jgi:mercuric ion transport protein